MADITIIGAGPAGISAALYTLRANLTTDIITNEDTSLSKAESIENYYGIERTISGKELYEIGIKQAEKLGGSIINAEVLKIEYDGQSFTVKTDKGNFSSTAVIMAMGQKRITANIKGLKDFEGSGVSYCAVCDAFFYRKKNVAVLGSGNYAISELNELRNTAAKTTLLLNGEKLSAPVPDETEVISKKIKYLDGKERLEKIVFDDGSELLTDGLFVAIGKAGSKDIARTLGIETIGNQIKVNEDMITNVNGLFAAGDCTPGLKQIAKAVCDGAKAGLAAIKFVREQKSK